LRGGDAVPAHGRDTAGGGVHFADPAVPRIRHEHVAVGQHGEVVRAVKLGDEGRPAIAESPAIG